MVTNNYWVSIKNLTVLFIVLINLVLPGCTSIAKPNHHHTMQTSHVYMNEEISPDSIYINASPTENPEVSLRDFSVPIYEDKEIADNQNELDQESPFADDELIEHYPFFGIWYLEKLLFSKDPAYLQGNDFSYSNSPIITDYIGSEMEFTHEYVRLAERIIYVSVYTDKQRISYKEKLFSFENDSYKWIPGYYTNPYEMLEDFEKQGIVIGREDESPERIVFDEIRMKYPHHRLGMFRGELIDLELVGENMAFNSLFLSFWVLNEEYILFGSNELILAKRVE